MQKQRKAERRFLRHRMGPRKKNRHFEWPHSCLYDWPCLHNCVHCARMQQIRMLRRRINFIVQSISKKCAKIACQDHQTWACICETTRCDRPKAANRPRTRCRGAPGADCAPPQTAPACQKGHAHSLHRSSRDFANSAARGCARRRRSRPNTTRRIWPDRANTSAQSSRESRQTLVDIEDLVFFLEFKERKRKK